MHTLLKAPLSFRWLNRVALGCCVAAVLFLVYALSLGPAMKLSGRKPGSKQMWPKWIYLTYYPLFRLEAQMPAAVDAVYERYLDLWYPEPQSAQAENE